jgi:hypothetical protein
MDLMHQTANLMAIESTGGRIPSEQDLRFRYATEYRSITTSHTPFCMAMVAGEGTTSGNGWSSKKLINSTDMTQWVYLNMERLVRRQYTTNLRLTFPTASKTRQHVRCARSYASHPTCKAVSPYIYIYILGLMDSNRQTTTSCHRRHCRTN